MGLISRKLCRFLLMFSTGFTSFSVLLHHPLLIYFFIFVHDFLFFFNFFSINPSANIFVFGDPNVHHKDWLTYFGRTDQSGEFCYNFSVSDDLTQMVNFPTQMPNCDYHSLALLDLFISSDVG